MALPKIPPLKGKRFFFLTTTKKVGEMVSRWSKILTNDKKQGIPAMVQDLAVLYHTEAMKTLRAKSKGAPNPDGLRTTLQPYAQHIRGRGWAVGVQTLSPIPGQYMRHINSAPSQQMKNVWSGPGSRFRNWGQSRGLSNSQIFARSRFEKRKTIYEAKNFAGPNSRAERMVIMNIQRNLTKTAIESLNKAGRQTRGGEIK